MRIIRPLSGNPKISMRFAPKFDYGKSDPEVSLEGHGLVFRTDRDRIHLQSNGSLTYLTEARPFELYNTQYYVMTHGEAFEKPIKFACEEYLERTSFYWRRWVKHCQIPYDYQKEVIRSALALKLHIFEDTGAIIAATTTSLPESEDGGRNWDYRYCWLRDAYFVIQVLNRLGRVDEMEGYIQYLHNIASANPDGKLQPVYGIGGEQVLTEKEIPWLKGFRGLGPVRVGNAAYTHEQHDVYGEMILAMAPVFFDARMELDLGRAMEKVAFLVEKAIAAFDTPDAGIWEVRSEQQHYTFSKLMCWAAVDRGIKIATQMKCLSSHRHWEEARNKMRHEIETKGWNQSEQFYAQVFKGSDPDAANLLMTALNFHPPAHERICQMVESYEKRLVNNGYLFRYRNQDDFGVPVNAFTICTFWYVDALISVGRHEEGRKLFERVLARANHVGLLSEDINCETGELWGNFPQTYSHVGVINSAFNLTRPWSKVY